MTLLGDARPVVGPAPAEETTRPSLWEVLEHLSVLAAVLGWGIVAAHASGGVQPSSILHGVELTLPALLLTRPWLRVSTPVLGLAGVLAVASVAVCTVTPTGWVRADIAASYSLAAALTVVAVAWVAGDGRLARRHRPTVLVTLIIFVGLEQMTQGLLAWWGGGDPSEAMTGTLGWRNQFAVFLVPATLLGLAVVVVGRRPISKAGWVAAPLGAACVTLASSRATLLLLVLAWAAVGVVLCLPAEARRARVLRLVGASLAAGVITVVLPGPPLFDHRASPLAATDARAAQGESLSANGGFRLQFWEEAALTGLHHPLTGAGYGSLGFTGGTYVPGSYAVSTQAHNGFLQVWEEGGLLLTLPVVGACGAVAFGTLRAGRRRWRDSAGGFEVPVAAAVVVLLAHSALDFDWSRPVLVAVPGLLAAAVGLGARPAGQPDRRVLPAVCVAALVLVPLGAAEVKLHADARLTRVSHAADRDRALANLAQAHPGDYRAGLALLQSTDRPADLDQVALSSTADLATIDTPVAVERALLQHRLGQDPTGVQRAYDRGLALARKRAYSAGSLAPLAHALGHDAELAPILRADLVKARAAQPVDADLVTLLGQALVTVGGQP